MMTLFRQCIAENRITDALLVGRNMLNKNMGNIEAFNAYFNFLCDLANRLPAIADRQSLAGQAGVALAFFSENAELSDDVVSSINAAQRELDDINDAINGAIRASSEVEDEAITKANEKMLISLTEMLGELRTATAQAIFDQILSSVNEVELRLDTDSLDSKQSLVYSKLTKDYTDVISSKMREFERIENATYNTRAVDAFSKAFATYKAAEATYKNQTKLYSLVSDSLFAFDASRLFNETLIYYNHIYSYIFSKLDDDGKLALTRFSIECEKSRR